MFKTFPEFSKLTLADREEYEALIKDFPPVSDISFVSQMLWWESIGEPVVSMLNDNLVVSYWIPGDERHSGLALVGTNNVDQSICAIFDYLRERGEEPRVVNVPEFVVNAIRYPELFRFKTDGSDDEYIIASDRFATLERLPVYMRLRIKKFMQEHKDEQIMVRAVRLSSVKNRQLLIDCSEEWPLRGVNNMTKRGREALPASVLSGAPLGVQCMGLFIQEVLQAYCLYFPTNDEQYITLAHARVNYDIPRIFDYMVHAFSSYLVSRNIRFADIYSDNGSQMMRTLKIALKPTGFFRKYMIEPV